MYLLCNTQHAKFGGFAKSENKFPGTAPFLVPVTKSDPLHSCLGLGSLSLFGESELLPFDAALCITKRAKDRLGKAPWRSPS
jgi:geranylgeranyl transferase type-1 subunit beta